MNGPAGKEPDQVPAAWADVAPANRSDAVPATRSDVVPATRSDVVPAGASGQKYSTLPPAARQAIVLHDASSEATAISAAITLLRRKLEAFFASVNTDPNLREDILGTLAVAESSSDQIVRLFLRERMEERAKNSGGVEILALQPVNISRVLINKIKYLRRVFGSEIFIDSKEIEQGVLVSADTGLLMEILTNIFQNAVESMKSVPERKNHLIVSLKAENGVCRIFIQDNGAGIDEEDGPHLFRYGYTTKKEGHGLGLFICRDRAQKMDGSFELINGSQMGCGATAVLELPVTGQDPPSRKG